MTGRQKWENIAWEWAKEWWNEYIIVLGTLKIKNVLLLCWKLYLELNIYQFLAIFSIKYEIYISNLRKIRVWDCMIFKQKDSFK